MADREVTITSNPADVGGALRMMARHQAASIDERTACPERIDEVIEVAEGLLLDAQRITGADHRDAEVLDRIEVLYAAARTARGED